MTKEDLLSFIVYVLMVAIAAVVGFAVISPAFSTIKTINGMNPAAFLVVALLIAVLLEVILFEIGHIVGAIIGGYEILSVNVLGFFFYKSFNEEKKKYVIKFKFPQEFNGLTGETIVVPKKKKTNPVSFVMTPLIIFAVEVALLVLAYILITDPKSGQNPVLFLKYFQLLVVTIGGMLFIYNYFPAKLDSMTDGYRLTLLNKKINVEAYNVLLTIEGDEFLGKEADTYTTFDEITDFTARVNLLSARNLLKKNNYVEANKLIETIIKNRNKVSNETYYLAKIMELNNLFIYGTTEDAKKFYDQMTDKEIQYLRTEFSMLTIRTCLLYYTLVDYSKTECEDQLHAVKKSLNKEKEINKKYEEGLLIKTIEFIKEKNKNVDITY